MIVEGMGEQRRNRRGVPAGPDRHARGLVVAPAVAVVAAIVVAPVAAVVTKVAAELTLQAGEVAIAFALGPDPLAAGVGAAKIAPAFAVGLSQCALILARNGAVIAPLRLGCGRDCGRGKQAGDGDGENTHITLPLGATGRRRALTQP